MRLVDINSVKLVTFDITGTLLKFRRKPVQVYIEVGKRNGVEVLDPEEMSKVFKTQWTQLNKDRPHYGTSWRDWWTQFVVQTFQNTPCRGATPEKLDTIAQDLIKVFNSRACWEVQDEGLQLVKALKAQNILLGVISNFDPRLHQILCAHDLLPYFDFVLTSHECQVSKPSSEIYKIGFNLGKTIEPSLTPGNVLHVGDNYELDYVGATGVGWKACLISGGGFRCGDCTIFPSLSSFHEYLRTQGLLPIPKPNPP